MTQPSPGGPAQTTAGLPEWPPMGAYPGETPHQTPTVYPADYPTEEFEPLIPWAAQHSADEPGEDEDEVGWHQRLSAEPFRAKHEKPGEWHTHAPDHLAFEHSPPAEVQPGVQHDEPDEAIPLSMLPHPWEVPFDPHATETAYDDERPRRRTGRWIVLALVLVLLLFAGGTVSAYLLLRDADSGKGAPDPATAVDRFMTAIYTQQNATAAENLVCREARDAAELQTRVNQIRAYATEYQAPSFSWENPSVSGLSTERATVGVQLTMTTDDEKSAEQRLTFTVIRKTGWLVCDVSG
ncbi:hypothetical protein GCM10010435_85830 [Winogradskya consettensis]|uniref:Ig-like domain-containing protein n=1 Tax=Winogradskya consettensis TaxID=113560 RepID=A0A919VR39_9ACTN|nr:hypothetical protein [Actinoplanes consettensis]GIM72490.1 hypothetical protein Aco04nite_30560 [Actinoplanes consettensis]